MNFSKQGSEGIEMLGALCYTVFDLFGKHAIPEFLIIVIIIKDKVFDEIQLLSFNWVNNRGSRFKPAIENCCN